MKSNENLIILQDDGRIYRYGDKFIKFPTSAIQSFIQWNTGPLKTQITFDYRMTCCLLFKCMGQDELIKNGANETVTTFVKSKKDFLSSIF